jgi:hypothetical protein
MPFQRTAFASIISAMRTRLAEYNLTVNWAGLQGEPQFWSGDYQITFAPGQATVDEGTATGTGRFGSLVRRQIELTLMTRTYEDEGERATVALLNHLSTEEVLIDALHLWMPDDLMGLVTEPIRMVGPSKPQQKQGIITSVLLFDALYPALLQSGATAG